VTSGVRIAIAAALLLAAAAGGTWWCTRMQIDTAAVVDERRERYAPSGAAPPSTAAGTMASPMAPLTVGEYVPDTAGLPPSDAAFAEQIPALRAAAAAGNATAACRLAVIGLRCPVAQATRWADMPELSEADRRATEEALRQEYGHVSLDALPEHYRAYAQRRLDTEALTKHDLVDRMRDWGRRCADVPTIRPDETLAALRQAALAGEPDSMARYASGVWMVEFLSPSLGMGFGHAGPGMGWIRSPGFDQWRQEAPAIRRAGLERGDPEMLWLEFAFAGTAGLQPLELAEPLDQAAALRAFASLVGGHVPESTESLGLSPAEAAEADRRADRWAARARERGRTANAVADGFMDQEMSACD
jgi:hypothetical protein